MISYLFLADSSLSPTWLKMVPSCCGVRLWMLWLDFEIEVSLASLSDTSRDLWVFFFSLTKIRYVLYLAVSSTCCAEDWEWKGDLMSILERYMAMLQEFGGGAAHQMDPVSQCDTDWDRGERNIVSNLSFTRGALELRMWTSPFPESTLSRPFWILAFAFVFGSGPLDLMSQIEKGQPWGREMVWTDVSLKRSDTVRGRRAWRVESNDELGQVLRVGPRACLVYLT